jgi:hypothetical protein
MKRIVCSVIVGILVAGVVVAAQPVVTRSKDITSKDIPLKFKVEKTTWDGTDIRIWGTVKNTGQVKYRSVKLIFTTKDAHGKFIGRNSWFADPSEMESGQVGYIEDKFVECDGARPALLEYSVIGEK